MSGDLHCHSICSDGSCTTAQIVEYARRQGITHIALTDHDTMMGVERIRQEAARKGLVRISGVECTARDRLRNRSAHMLCYLPEKPLELQRFLDTTLARRREAKLAMVDKLAQRYPLTREDVLLASKDSASIHEVHLMAPLAAMGYTPAVCGPLLRELLGKDGSCYVPIIYPDVYEVLEAIHSVGGLAVLAHPGRSPTQQCRGTAGGTCVMPALWLTHDRRHGLSWYVCRQSTSHWKLHHFRGAAQTSAQQGCTLWKGRAVRPGCDFATGAGPDTATRPSGLPHG